MINNTSAAPHPFVNTDDADIVLRSQDGVEFHVHKVVLAFVSPYFKHMFLLPSNLNDGQSLPIDVPESSQIWESLLRLCYRVDDPSFRNIDAVADVIAAAIKYELLYAIKFMRTVLRSYIQSNALDVFAIAYRLDLMEETREAASCLYSSRTPPAKSAAVGWANTLEGKMFSPKIQSLLTAGDLFRLLKYLRTDPYPKNYSWNPIGEEKSAPQSSTILDLGFDTSDADLILKSSDGVEFRVHKLIIFLASANQLCNAPVESDNDALPMICLSENSITLSTLISMCYPVAELDFEDLSNVYEVLKAAMKFEMKKIIQTLRIKLAYHIERDPLRVYLTSIALGLKEEAIKASKVFSLSSDDPANAYAHEMEVVPAIAYHRLLKYLYQCRETAINKWDEYNPRRSHPGYISKGTIALPVMELDWDKEHPSSFNFPSTSAATLKFQKSSSLMEASNRVLREIRDLVAKV